MDVPVTLDPADVLALASRRQLFEALADSRGPMTTAELSARTGRHPNGVRSHLDRLEKAGLVIRSQHRLGGRGRPGDRWMVAAGARPGGDPPTAYRDLVRWLVRAIQPSPASLARVETAGMEIGAELGATQQSRLPGALTETFSALGFEPAVSRSDQETMTICLGNCPYRDAAGENFDLVCRLHRGLTSGLIEAVDPEAELIEFTPNDPERAGCIVRIGNVADELDENEPERGRI